MILRVIRGQVFSGREADFVDLCRRTVADRARAPGLVSFFPGYRRADGIDSFILVSMWESAEDADSAAGRADSPTAKSVLASVADVDAAQVYEGLAPIFHGLIDAPGGVVRVTSALVKPGRRDDLFAWLANTMRRGRPQRLLLGWAIGERPVEGGDELIGISAWPSPLVIEALAEPGATDGLLFSGAEQFVTGINVEHYRAIGLDLPSELSDLGARRVLAARFETREAADAAAAVLSREMTSSAGEESASVAPLGAPGSAADVRSWILVMRVPLSSYARAERLIDDHGGDVVLATREEDPAPEAAGQPSWSASPAN